MCNRRFWIWSDWILIIEKSGKAQYKYTMFNSDWSVAEMCGNGIRCFMKYLLNKSLVKTSDKVSVETWAWILSLWMSNWLVEVDMGPPILDSEKIPIITKLTKIASFDREFDFVWVSMWNPHCVIYLKEGENLDTFDLEIYWKPIENNLEYFPNRINTEFVEFISSTHIKMRVWERGCGETISCWTWVCASVVAWIVNWKLEKSKDIKVDIKWGELIIKWTWEKSDSVIMKWPAEKVYKGEYLLI